MPECPDEELIRRFCANGDRAAFDALVRRHAPRVRRMLYGLLGGSREDMEDAEQEVVAAMFGALHRFRFRSGLSTWLYRVARNRAIDMIRRRERERRSLARLLLEGGREEPHPEEVAVASVERGEAMALLSTLRPAIAEVVLLREVEGLSIEEIARVLRVPRGTVKSRLHRGRARIERAIAAGEARGGDDA